MVLKEKHVGFYYHNDVLDRILGCLLAFCIYIYWALIGLRERAKTQSYVLTALEGGGGSIKSVKGHKACTRKKISTIKM